MGYLAFVQTIKDSSNQNLTTLGGLDWRHWSGFSQSSSSRKTSGSGLSNLSAIGSIIADQNAASGRTVTASDPSLSSDDAGVYYGANGTTGWGERFTVDIGTTRKKCWILFGQFSGAVKVDISLSDSSASAISYTYSASSIYSTEGLLVEFDLEANSASQTATVDITCSTNIDAMRIGVQATALSNAGAGSQSLTPSLYTNTNTFYSPTVNSTYALTPSLYTNTQTFYAPTVSATKALTPSLYTNSQTFYAPTVSQGVTIEPSLYTNNQTFYNPSVSVGAVTLQSALYENTNVFYTATITGGIQPVIVRETSAGSPPQRQKQRPVVVIRDDEEQAQVTIKQIKRLVARRIGKAPIKQEVERQAVELSQIFPIDLTEATELIDNITQQEIIANMRRRQNQDDEQAIKLLLGLE